jgi:NAD(P)-dependent dehydrogenase (short-subunit alcohol dehydrogenase family)
MDMVSSQALPKALLDQCAPRVDYLCEVSIHPSCGCQHSALIVQTTKSESSERLSELIELPHAAYQNTFNSIDELSDQEWQHTFAVNIHAMFYLTKAAVPHMKPGAAIINTTSVQADDPSQELLAYASTKVAIQNFTGGLAQMLAEKGLRANCVAPGPIWTPLILATMPEEKVKSFGEQVPMKRPGQPRELAPVYVLLASDEASYISGATIAVTGGKPII